MPAKKIPAFEDGSVYAIEAVDSSARVYVHFLLGILYAYRYFDAAELTLEEVVRLPVAFRCLASSHGLSTRPWSSRTRLVGVRTPLDENLIEVVFGYPEEREVSCWNPRTGDVIWTAVERQ